MIKSILIKNYILMDEIILYPSSESNIITGETGAGKSIFINSLKLLLGTKMKENKFLNNDKKCIIEAKFELSINYLHDIINDIEKDLHIAKSIKKDQSFKILKDIISEILSGSPYDNIIDEKNTEKRELIIRREISIKGRSRAFIHDTPVSLTDLRYIMNKLIDIHSQYDNLIVKNHDYQLKLIDNFAVNICIKNRNKLQVLKSAYQEKYRKHKEICQKYNTLKTKTETTIQEIDYKKFLLNELESANLEKLDLKKITTEVRILENAESLKYDLNQAYYLLENSEDSIVNKLGEVTKLISQNSELKNFYLELFERIQSCNIELQDISKDISFEIPKIEIDATFLAENKSKIDNIYSLFKKHRVKDIKELLALKNTIKAKITNSEEVEGQINELLEQMEEVRGEAYNKAKELSEYRKGVLKEFKLKIAPLFGNVGMVSAKIDIEIKETELSESGIDKVNIFFNANKGHKLLKIDECASGGELSRLMLCFKYLCMSANENYKTFIFDEIDTGISGEIAFKVGKMLEEISLQHQLFIITHLPQVAIVGDRHYIVYKENDGAITRSYIKELSQNERKLEIAKMISGNKITDMAIKTAEELLCAQPNLI